MREQKWDASTPDKNNDVRTVEMRRWLRRRNATESSRHLDGIEKTAKKVK